MKKYKFITIDSESAGQFDIWNNKTEDNLGHIIRYELWHQWVFVAYDDSLWSASCLRDVIDFIENEIPKATR